MTELAKIFATFAKMGCVTFGGGYTILPVAERELVRRRGWVSADEILKYYTISQVTPGIISVNLCSFVGYKRSGVAGAIVATLGFVLPSATIVVCIAQALRNFADLPVARHCFNGVRLAVGALVLDTIVRLARQLVKKDRGILRNAAAVALCAASFLVSAIWNANPVFVVIAAGLAGFFLTGKKKAP